MIQDKIMLKTILQDFTDELFRYYITNSPQITKSDNVDRGYGGETNTRQSIHFQFMTTKPSRKELENGGKDVRGNIKHKIIGEILMSKMIETNVDPKLMISKLKNVKEKVEEMGTEGSR